jgi:hypothetical protein
VGRAETGTLPIHRPVIERWNDSSWRIDGVSANDLWAVGHTRNGDYPMAEPLALHWNGSAWSIVPTPTANDATLEGVVALASNDVWAVGSLFSVAQLWHVPFALHWDGRSWTRVDVPSPTPQGGRLFGVAAPSPTKVNAAVGSAPGIPSLVLRWNGGAWTRESNPATGTVWDAAAAGPGAVWAVGQRGNPNTGVGRTFTLRTGNS